MDVSKVERREYRAECPFADDEICVWARTESGPLGPDARVDDTYCQHGSLIRSVVNVWVRA
jgi:hypothetical protein